MVLPFLLVRGSEKWSLFPSPRFFIILKVYPGQPRTKMLRKIRNNIDFTSYFLKCAEVINLMIFLAFLIPMIRKSQSAFSLSWMVWTRKFLDKKSRFLCVLVPSRGGTFLSPDPRSEGFLRGLKYFPENLRGMKIFPKNCKGYENFLENCKGYENYPENCKGYEIF